MSSKNANNTESSGRTAIVLVCGLCASLSLHFVAAATMIGYTQSSWARGSVEPTDIFVADTTEPPESIELGEEDSTSASINWLGVIERPQEGRAEESIVEQAALTLNPGATSIPAEAAQAEPTQTETQSTAAEPIEQADEAPAPSTSAPVPQMIDLPPMPDQGILEVERDEKPTEKLIEESPAQPPEQAAETPSEAQLQAATEQPTEQVREEPAENTQEPKLERVVPAGIPGQLARKEAVASTLRNAEDIEYNRLNRPLVSKGLEIMPREPKYPRAVLNSSLPRNAIVVIQFGRDGRVKRAEFLVSADGKRTYDTGSQSVDGPLLAAIYTWTAKGKQLLELDPSDSNATIEIPMRILFSRPRYEKTDG